jgi:hypothetical protein
MAGPDTLAAMVIPRTIPLAAILAASCAAGCGTTADAPRGAAPPDDFALEVTRIPAAGRPGDTGPRAARRLVLFPGGALHEGPAPHGRSVASAVDRLPPLVRTLGAPEIAEVWSLLAAAEVEAPPGAPVNVELLDAPESGALYAIAWAAGDERRAIVRDSVSAGPAVTALLERLALLSWMREEAAATAPAPRRYDLGPDPYARYRR